MVPHMKGIIGELCLIYVSNHKTHEPYCPIGTVHTVEPSQECKPLIFN